MAKKRFGDLGGTLTKAEVRRASRLLKAEGRRLPKIGYCIELAPKPQSHSKHSEYQRRVEICHSGRTYFLIGQYSTDARRAALRK
jgi:hypothetical protein